MAIPTLDEYLETIPNDDKRDVASFWRPKEHEPAAAEAVASGEKPPTVRERAADDGQLADSFLEEFQRYADNPTPGHPFEQLNEQLKQALRDYEANPDDVYTLDEVRAELDEVRAELDLD